MSEPLRAGPFKARATKDGPVIDRPTFLLHANEPLAASTLRVIAATLHAAGHHQRGAELEALARDFDQWLALGLEVGQATLCDCGAWKARGAQMCMACRRQAGWHHKTPRRGRTFKIPPSVLERARVMHEEDGKSFRTIARALIDETTSKSLGGLTESIRHQARQRGWLKRGVAPVLNAEEAAALIREQDGRPARRPPRPPNPHVFREFVHPGDMSRLEYLDANNECHHGWLPHEGCRDCAGVIPLREAA